MPDKIYNASVTGKILLTPDLMILRIRSDEPRPQFNAGQYTTIGVLAKEPRSANSVLTIEEYKSNELITRPYSIASANHETSNFEFYISQVKSGALTPRLFGLSQGSRMWIDDKILGIFLLNQTPPDCNIVMVATGTGLAPYISFLRSHIADHKNIKLAIIHGAAYPWDLGYYSELHLLKNAFNNFYYFPTLLKPVVGWNGLVGYIENHLNKDILQKEAGIDVDPEKTHFYLCGNPKMVKSVTSYLEDRNYKRHTKNQNGSLHIEEY